MIDFSRIPFVRLLIPFVSGIILCRITEINSNVFYLLLASFFILCLLYFLNNKKSTPLLSGLFLTVSDIFLLLSAVFSYYQFKPINCPDYYGNFISKDKVEWVGEIIDLPVEKEKFIKTILRVKSIEINGKAEEKSGDVLGYFRKPFDKNKLSPGNQLTIKSEFITINPPLNPGEFNYKQYLSDKRIHFQTFVDSGQGSLSGCAGNFSIYNYGLRIKSKLINLLNNGNLNHNAAQLCNALLTGYDDEISPETINAFAHSGTLHVLSVSGLHTGILFAVIVFILGLADRNNRFKKIQLIVLLAVLWFFVMIAGFSPPVLRAAIMLSFLALGKYYYNYLANASLNILAVSAFVILLFNPLLLFDTGFLLSYTAVLGILLFGPSIEKLYVSENRIVNKIWQLSCVSLAAQLSTLPVTLLFFHQFPLWFVLTNLVVIPLCTILMFLAILFVFKAVFLSTIINFITAAVLNIIQLTNSPGMGYIDKIDFNVTDTAFLTVIIIAFFMLLKKRNYYYVVCALSLIIVWQVFLFVDAISKKQEISFLIYQVNNKSACDFKNAEDLYYTSKLTENDYNFHVINQHTAYNYPGIFSVNFDYIKTNKCSILRINKEQNLELINFLKPDYIVLSDNSIIKENFVLSYKPICIIADGSVKFGELKKVKKYCNKFEIDFYSTRENGFLKLPL